jgi:hypothetical protein
MVAASVTWINEKLLIPELLGNAPQARPVLDRYGLRGCGGPLGPVETLGFFAKAHDVPLDRLLREIREAVIQPEPAPATKAEDQQADTIYLPFFQAGIAIVLSLGAAWGAYLLLRIAITGSFAAAGIHEINAHGHAQIFGWVGLFVMGFAYQAFPRFKHTTLAHVGLARSTLWLMLAGIVVRSACEPLAASFAWLGNLAIAASVVELIAIVFFVIVISGTLCRSGKPLEFYDYYIISSLGWFVIQGVYEVLYLAATLAQPQQLVPLVATWQGALRDIQIHGFALVMILGVSQRMFHHFYGLPAPNRRLSLIALGCVNAAVAGEATGLVLMRIANQSWAALWYASVLVLTGAVGALIANWHLFARPEESDRSLKFLRTAYGWLFLSLGMLVFLPLYQFIIVAQWAPESNAAKIGFSHAYHGATRHAITVGFISLMIVGVAAKVVPTLNGLDVRKLSPLWLPFVLINFGCALRVSSQTLTDFTTSSFPFAGASGVLEVAGLAVWGIHLWGILLGRIPASRSARSDRQVLDPNAPITPASIVGEVLDQHPELLQVFLSFGFKPLANPLLRRTLAGTIAIQQACRLLGQDPSPLVEALNAARLAKVLHRYELPVLSTSGWVKEELGSL